MFGMNRDLSVHIYKDEEFEGSQGTLKPKSEPQPTGDVPSDDSVSSEE